MPKERDPKRLELLARILLGAFGSVVFNQRAFRGYLAEPDDIGLLRFYGANVSEVEIRMHFRDALAEFLRNRNVPNRVNVQGDEQRGDPATFYEFRLVLCGKKAYVKTELNLDDAKHPILTIMKVARQN